MMLPRGSLSGIVRRRTDQSTDAPAGLPIFYTSNRLGTMLYRRSLLVERIHKPSSEPYSKMLKPQKATLRLFHRISLVLGLTVIGLGSINFVRLNMPQGGKEIKKDGVNSFNIEHRRDLPVHWRPPRSLQGATYMRSNPWSPQEQALIEEATQTGLDELIDYLAGMSREALLEMGVDTVNCLMDEAYAASDLDYQQRALQAAHPILVLQTQYIMKAYQGSCTNGYDLLKYVAYSQYLTDRLHSDEVHDYHLQLVNYVNRVLYNCDKDLDLILGIRNTAHLYDTADELTPDDIDEIFEWTLKVIGLIDASAVQPSLNLPQPATDNMVAGYWNLVHKYHQQLFPSAHSTSKHYFNGRVREMAWVVTHAAYVPTGYGRHQQLLEDAPWLYEYIRENLYMTLEFNMLDLVCEFVDLLRQYGCTEDDVQVRDATRYVLELYTDANHSWMDHRNPHQSLTDYNQIHKPWTAIGAIVSRDFDPVVKGSYGWEFRQIMKRQGGLRRKQVRKR